MLLLFEDLCVPPVAKSLPFDIFEDNAKTGTNQDLGTGKKETCAPINQKVVITLECNCTVTFYAVFKAQTTDYAKIRIHPVVLATPKECI